MKQAAIFLLINFITISVIAQDFYLASNGVTCMCPNAAVGDSGDPGDGVVYTKRYANEVNASNASTTCTSGIGGIIPNWFTGDVNFNEDISTWDVSNFENMQDFLAGCTSFNQDLGHWQFQYWVLMQGLLDDTNLSVENYDSFILNLIGQNIAPTTIGVNGLVYCDETSRNELINQGWNFDGDSPQELFFEAPGDISLTIQSPPCETINLDLGIPVHSGCDPIIIQNDAPSEFPVGQTVINWIMLDGNQNELVDQQVVNIEMIADEAQICYVTTDVSFPLNNRVFITQDLVSPNLNVDYHEVLRETNVSGQYETIGFINPPEMSFLDSNSNNTLQSYRYKVRTINVCGAPQTESEFHKTILLQSNIATDNSVNLVWNEYEGAVISTYYINRSTNGGPFELIAQVAGSNNAFNDTQADVTVNFYDYFVEFEITDCNTTPLNPIFARSNNEYINPNLGINDLRADQQKFILLPNPTSGEVRIISEEYMRFSKIELFNISGQKIKEYSRDIEEFNIDFLKSGMYLLALYHKDKVEFKSIIKK